MSLDKTKICHELNVLERIQETEDTISLVLEIPRTKGGKFLYKAGQFVTLFLDIKGEEIRRSYSLASSPEVETDFKISIKLVPGGKGSTYLMDYVKAGDKLWATPPAGFFCLPTHIKENQKFVFYAGGSGITPIISLIKSALKLSNTAECVLFYQNKKSSNIIFKNELQQIVKQYSMRLKIEHVLSQPDSTWTGLSGRADKSLITNFITENKITSSAIHYMCGPDGFMTAVTDALIGSNIPKENIIKESFAVTSTSPSVNHTAASLKDSGSAQASAGDFELDTDSIVIGDRESLSAPQTIEALIDGETHTIPYKKDRTILECLLDADLNPPYSCLDGACMACIAKIQEGLVYQNDMGILTEDNIKAKECLTCQARPASKFTKVNYEIL